MKKRFGGRRAVTAITCALALSLAPRAASAQYLSYSRQGGGILVIVVGVAGLAGATAAILGTVTSDACSRGPNHDGAECGGFITGSTLVTAASLALIGVGIYAVATPERQKRMSLTPWVAGLPAPASRIELLPTLGGLSLRSTF